MKMGTDHRPKRRKVYLSSKSNFQSLGRESAGLNLKRHSRPLVRVQIKQHIFWIFIKLFFLMKNQINIETVKKKKKKKKWFVLVFYNTGYVADMMDLLFEKVFVNPTPYTDELLAIPVPEYLSAQYEKPDKEEVIASFVSRFKQGAV